MSKPVVGSTIGEAMSEIVSAISALNMPPEPVDPQPERTGRPAFLSESDEWARHAKEHMRAAFETLVKAEADSTTRAFRDSLRREFEKCKRKDQDERAAALETIERMLGGYVPVYADEREEFRRRPRRS